MKSKVYITLVLIALWGGLAAFLSRSAEVATKYMSMNQFNNSEADLQLLSAAGNATYANYFILAALLFALASIWKPKSTQTQTIDE